MKFLKKSIKIEGKSTPVFYSKDGRIDEVKGLTIYAKCILNKLPAELNPKNDSDGIIDYFETDKVFIPVGSSLFKQVEEIYNSIN